MVKSILQKYFSYFRELDQLSQATFLRRAEIFIHTKQFHERGELPEVTLEMKTLVAAYAIQVSFGLGDISYDHFETVLIYPEEFYSNHSNTHKKAEAHPDGIIVFSWKDLAFANLFPGQAINYGLNTFARALGIEYVEAKADVFDPYYLRDWVSKADAEFERLKSENLTFYNYGVISQREDFFPACTDYFFEKPEALKKEFPDLYITLTALLQQYP